MCFFNCLLLHQAAGNEHVLHTVSPEHLHPWKHIPITTTCFSTNIISEYVISYFFFHPQYARVMCGLSSNVFTINSLVILSSYMEMSLTVSTHLASPSTQAVFSDLPCYWIHISQHSLLASFLLLGIHHSQSCHVSWWEVFQHKIYQCSYL